MKPLPENRCLSELKDITPLNAKQIFKGWPSKRVIFGYKLCGSYSCEVQVARALLNQGLYEDFAGKNQDRYMVSPRLAESLPSPVMG
jgi:hypothetical protein